eukprot:COSAG01_NODE_73032_length_251_cov_0.789474_1_plen_22_part_01
MTPICFVVARAAHDAGHKRQQH